MTRLRFRMERGAEAPGEDPVLSARVFTVPVLCLSQSCTYDGKSLYNGFPGTVRIHSFSRASRTAFGNDSWKSLGV